MNKSDNLKKCLTIYFTETFNERTIELLSSLSFNGYCLAGDAVADMMDKRPLTSDLDFFSLKNGEYLKILDEFSSHYDIFEIHAQKVVMIDLNGILPTAKLFYTKFEYETELIREFDLDYCRCFWPTPFNTTSYNRIYSNLNCDKAHSSKTIPFSGTKCSARRISKILSSGYKFSDHFWYVHRKLLEKRSISKSSNKIKSEDIKIPYDESYNLFQSNISDVLKTLNYIKPYLESESSRYIKAFLTLDKKKFHDFNMLLKQYALAIVMQNPLTEENFSSMINHRFTPKIDTKTQDKDQVQKLDDRVDPITESKDQGQDQEPKEETKEKTKEELNIKVKDINITIFGESLEGLSVKFEGEKVDSKSKIVLSFD